MLFFSLSLPPDFDDYAFEVEAKGWFAEAWLSIEGKRYRLNFYDETRIRQEIESEISVQKLFFEPNLVIIRSVTRANMHSAAEQLVRSRAILAPSID